jgi:hypothetical protein
MSGQTYLRVLVGVKRWRSVQTCALLFFDRPTGTAAKSFSPVPHPHPEVAALLPSLCHTFTRAALSSPKDGAELLPSGS